MRYLFKSINLIGDALNISPAWRQWILNLKSGIVFSEIYMQTLPDHTASLYQGMVRDLVRIQTVFDKPEGQFDFEHTFDVNKAFEVCDKKKCHIAEAYAELLGVTLPGEGNVRLKPIFIPDYVREHEVHDASEEIRLTQGCILVSMFSASCTSRDKNVQGLPPNKMLPWHKWKPMLKLLRQEFPNVPIRFLGAPTDRVPTPWATELEIKDEEYLTGIPLNRLALIMKQAKLLITIDNGMSHLGASQEMRMFLLYPRCLGLHYILPKGNPNMNYIHMDPITVNPAQLRHELKYVIDKIKETT